MILHDGKEPKQTDISNTIDTRVGAIPYFNATYIKDNYPD